MRSRILGRASSGALVVAVALVSVACAGASIPSFTPGMTIVAAPGGTYTRVSAAGLADMLRAKDFVLVNTHVPYEGEIEGTDVSIPYDRTASEVGKLPQAMNAKIFLYCRSGRMSAVAAATLVGLGYTNIWDLDGGMIAWEQAGYPLVQRPPS